MKFNMFFFVFAILVAAASVIGAPSPRWNPFKKLERVGQNIRDGIIKAGPAVAVVGTPTIQSSILDIIDMPSSLSTEIKNETETEQLGCMKDFVVCLRSHKLLPRNIDVLIDDEHPANNSAKSAHEVCALNPTNDVRQFDNVCEVVYTNCVLKKDNFWSYIGDGTCEDIMKMAQASPQTPPPEPDIFKNMTWRSNGRARAHIPARPQGASSSPSLLSDEAAPAEMS